MYDSQSLSHSKWECKYHIVWIPKYRKKALFVELRKYLGEILRELAKQKECEVLEGHLMPDHVHIMLSIPPKYSVSQVVGFIKGKSAIQIARNFQGRKKNFVGQNFWARGYYVSTAGKDEEVVRAYIQAQEKEDQRLEQLKLFNRFERFRISSHRLCRWYLTIFDNFETLLYLDEQEEIKAILSKIADYAKVLVTCRELLKIEGKVDYQMRQLTTDEAADLFTSMFHVPPQEKELLRQEILGPLLDNSPLAITLITSDLPKGKSLAVLKEALEKNRLKTIDSDLHIFDSGSDTNIDRKKSMYACILYSYNRLSKDEKIAFELLSLFPDGIDLEEFKKLTRKSEEKKKMPPLLITDRLVKSLDDKSMIENSGGHIKHQSIVGKFAEAMLNKREKEENIAPLYRNAFAYNRWLAFSLRAMLEPSEETKKALEIFSSQQGNFLSAVKYCDRFEADEEELLEYFHYCSELFVAICSSDGFIRELLGKIDLFQDKERKCAEVILLWSKYYNGDFSRVFAQLQYVLPMEQISSLDGSIVSERLLAGAAWDIYEMEGEALWAAEHAAQHHTPYLDYPSELLSIGEYSTQLAAVCQDAFHTFEVLANLGQLDVKRIDAFFVGIYEKAHLQQMQVSYTRAKLRPLQRRKIEPLVVVNPYTRGLKKLMLAFIEEDADKANTLYREAAEHLWHIRYYHVEALYFHAAFLHKQHAAEFAEIHQRGLELAKKHHYRFLQYRFEELLHPTGLVYDQRNYPLPDNKDFSEYINFLIKQNKALKDGPKRVVRG